MLIPCDEVNILNTFRVMIILRLLLLLTNLHLKLLSTQGTGADKLLSTQRVKERQAKDLETLNEMIEQIAVESEEEIKIDKIIRLGTRGANFKDNPRPAIVSFSTIESKKFVI